MQNNKVLQINKIVWKPSSQMGKKYKETVHERGNLNRQINKIKQ